MNTKISDEIQQIVFLELQNKASTDMEMNCVICQEDINTIFYCHLKCGHLYHSNCIQPWKKTQNTCPQCRSEIQCINHSEHSETVLNSVIYRQDRVISELKSQNREMEQHILGLEMIHSEAQIQIAAQQLMFFIYDSKCRGRG
jgi:hypothetical protein